jgi:predicted DNA binding CopG/RHH family protein
MAKKKRKIVLDSYEQDIEDNFEKTTSLPSIKSEMTKIMSAAKAHVLRRKSITLRVSEMDLEAIKIKASKKGLPYQTYLNMIIHENANTLEL